MTVAASSSAPILCAKGLHFGYRAGSETIIDASMLLRPGDLLGLVGENGAGKSTLLELLGGALRPRGGRISLLGEEVTHWSLAQRARHRVGFLPQQASVFRGLTVRDNLLAATELQPEPFADVDTTLRRLELSQLADRRASELSGGERRRVELARLFVTSPRVLLLDEPFAGLDRRCCGIVAQEMLRMAHAGAAILIAEQRIDHLKRLCGQLFAMRDGRPVSIDANALLVADAYNLGQSGGGPMQLERQLWD